MHKFVLKLMKTMLLKKTTLLLLLFGFSLALKAQTVEDIIAGYIHFTGGEKQWETIHSVKSSGTYNYGGLEFPFEAWSKAPDLYKYMVTTNGKHFAQAFDGTQGWKIDEFKGETTKTILTGKAARAMANEADVELESPFINLKEKSYQAMLEGKDSVGNMLCYKVKLIKNNDDTATYFFSTNDFSLIKKQAVSKNAELENSMLDTYYRNYRLVHGVIIPFEMTSKIKEQTILTIAVEKIEFNIPIPDSDFKP